MVSKRETGFVCLAVMAFKLLLSPAYTSTDFEVHRNWLAVTSLPLTEWYTEATSQWTLDYPPMFGWFEWVLSRLARLFDEHMLELSSLPYKSQETVFFQRASVVATDLVLLYGIQVMASALGRPFADGQKTTHPRTNPAFSLLIGGILANAGLIIVDNVHFQYNGLLFGVQLTSLALAWEGRYLASGASFAVLLQLKHIFLYVAPAYFVFLLSAYCCKHPGVLRSLCIRRLANLGGVVILVFSASLGPFVLHGQLQTMVNRLFPFTRGLSHAYWAPNVWALYNTADRALTRLFARSLSGGPTRGLVQDVVHEVLPAVSPIACAILLVSCILPALWSLFRNPTRDRFLACVGFCAMSSFQLGWHVHEKASLMILVPLMPLAVLELVGCCSMVSADESNESRRPRPQPVWRLCTLIAVLADLTVLPLVYRPFEIALRTLLVVCHVCGLVWVGRSLQVPLQPREHSWVTLLEQMYYVGLALVEVLVSAVLPYFFPSLPFLPLLMRSSFYSVGFMACWAGTACLAMRAAA